jgi:hypothetical protein
MRTVQHQREQGSLARVEEQIRRKFNEPVGNNLAQNLDLPQLARPYKNGRDKAAYETQSYKSFADGVEKKNPDVIFDKEMMDEAFRVALPKIPTQ